MPMARPAAPPTAESRPHLLTRGFTLTCLCTFFFFLSFYLLLPTLPLYALQYGMGESEIGLIIGAFSLTALVVRPYVGRAIDRRGRKGMVLLGTAVFLTASLAYHYTRTVGSLLALRLLHGSGMGFFTTAASAVITDLAPPARRGEAMGYFGLAANLAMAVGPALGMRLASDGTFGGLFLAAGGVALVAVLLGTGVPETLLAGTTPPAAAPLFSRRALFPAGAMLSLCVTYGAVVSFLPLLGRQVGMGNPGLFFTIYAVFLVLTRPVAGPLSDRVGRAAVVLPGMALVAAATGTLAAASAPGWLLLAGALYGIGFGAAHPALMALTADRVEAAERGRAMATFYAALELGIGSGSVLLGVLLAYSSFPAMFGAAAAIAAAGTLGFLFGYRRL
ncbi:MAG: MFS transporter [candidate division NC10 bacterium]